MKVKVSHEVPLQLLGLSETFNGYDYCLPHLLDKYPEYEAYFRQAKEKGRYIIYVCGCVYMFEACNKYGKHTHAYTTRTHWQRRATGR